MPQRLIQQRSDFIDMFPNALLAALYVVMAAAAPLALPHDRLLGVGTLPGGGDDGGISLPIPLPTGTGAGLGGAAAGGLPTLPTSLEGGGGAAVLPTGFPTLTGQALPPVPTGLGSGTLSAHAPEYIAIRGTDVVGKGCPDDAAKRQLSIPGSGSAGGGLGDLSGMGGGLGGDGLSLPTGLGGLGGFGGSGGGGLSFPSGGLLGGIGSGSGSGSGVALPLPTGIAGRSGSSGSSSGSGLGDGSSISARGGDCKEVSMIFARGTTEMGTLGTVVGPGLVSDTKEAVGAAKVAVEGVDYPASAEGNVDEVMGSGDGSKAMAADAVQVLSACPDTELVLAGYSQGAMVAHNAMKMLDASQQARVKACVTFGDPFVGDMPAGLAKGAFKSFCGTGDVLCSSEAASSPSSGGTESESTTGHLGYGADTAAAAKFIASMVAA